MGKLASQLPALLADAERVFASMAEMARGGIRLDDATIARLAAAEAERTRSSRAALWIIALTGLALVAILAFASR
jgi:ubiquinone biosynthesis protein